MACPEANPLSAAAADAPAEAIELISTGALARGGAAVTEPRCWVWRPSLPGTITAHLLAPGDGERARTLCGRDGAPRDRFEPAPALLRRCRACQQRMDDRCGAE